MILCYYNGCLGQLYTNCEHIQRIQQFRMRSLIRRLLGLLSVLLFMDPPNFPLLILFTAKIYWIKLLKLSPKQSPRYFFFFSRQHFIKHPLFSCTKWYASTSHSSQLRQSPNLLKHLNAHGRSTLIRIASFEGTWYEMLSTLYMHLHSPSMTFHSL